MAPDEGGESPRQQILQAQTQLRRLKRSLSAAPRLTPAQRWKDLRRALERLRDLLADWSQDQEPAGAGLEDPAALRARNELEARALRVETALRELEERQSSLDADRQRAWAELERVQDGWRLLRQRAAGKSALPEGSLAALRQKVADITAQWERALAEQAETTRETQSLDRVWRWLMTVSLPELERRASGADRTLLLPTLRRLLQELDRRWGQARAAAEAPASPEGALAAAQDLVASREARIGLLSRELEFLKGALEEARRQSETWRQQFDAARAEQAAASERVARGLAELREAERQRDAVAKSYAQAEESISALKNRLEEAAGQRDDERRRDGARRELQRLSAALNEALGRLDEQKRQAAQASQERARLLSFFTKGERTIETQAERIAALEKALTDWKERCESFETSLEAGRGLAADIERRAQATAQRRADEFDQERRRLAAGIEELRQRQAAMAAQELVLRQTAAEARGLAQAAQAQAERQRAACEAARRDAELARMSQQEFEVKYARLEQRFQAALAHLGSSITAAKEVAQMASEGLGFQKEATQAQLGKAASDLAREQAESAKTEAERRLQEAVERLQASVASAQEAETPEGKPEAPAAPPAGAAEAPSLDPGWARALERLRLPVAAAYARLRQLSAAQLPDGPKALARMTAGSLAEANDLLRSLVEFTDDAGAPAAAVKPEAVLESVLASWEQPLRRRRISLTRLCEPGLPSVRANSESLRTALHHVVRNAYEALKGGTLLVRGYRDPATGQICLSFSDSGKGFSSEALASLFQPFTTTKKDHLGLGLALARRVVRRWGGEVEAANREGGGGAVILVRLAPASGDGQVS